MRSVTLKSAMTPSFIGRDGHDVAGRAAQHLLRFFAHRFDFAGVLVDGDDGRLVDDDALAFGENKRIGGAQIDRKVRGKKAEKRAEIHRWIFRVNSSIDLSWKARRRCDGINVSAWI